MVINRFGRTPLGAFWRSALGVRGQFIYCLRDCNDAGNVIYTDTDVSGQLNKVVDVGGTCYGVTRVVRGTQTVSPVTVAANHDVCADCTGDVTHNGCAHCPTNKTPATLELTFVGVDPCPCDGFGGKAIWTPNGAHQVTIPDPGCSGITNIAATNLVENWTNSDCTGSISSYINRGVRINVEITAGPTLTVFVDDDEPQEWFRGSVELPACDFPAVIPNTQDCGLNPIFYRASSGECQINIT